MCRGFCARGTDLILDVCITDADNPTNKVQPVEKVLQEHDHKKKKLYLRKCLDQRGQFAPYKMTADRDLGKGAYAFHKTLSYCLAKK